MKVKSIGHSNNGQYSIAKEGLHHLTNNRIFSSHLCCLNEKQERCAAWEGECSRNSTTAWEREVHCVGVGRYSTAEAPAKRFCNHKMFHVRFAGGSVPTLGYMYT